MSTDVTGGRPASPAETPGVRARARAETTARALEIATRQLGEVGPAALSVRSIARELGIASSAIYRYFPSRDALLTRLILDAYTDLGRSAAEAEGAVDRADHAGRFRAAARGARRWSIDNPHRYALIYGTPVPGYAAPQDTVVPALSVAMLLLSAVADAVDAGAAVEGPALPPTLADELSRAAQTLGRPVEAGVLALGIESWTALYGHLSFEIFGQYHRVVDDRDAFFELFLDGQLARFGLA
jgi:AcrR family transcriptional regulator